MATRKKSRPTLQVQLAAAGLSQLAADWQPRGGCVFTKLNWRWQTAAVMFDMAAVMRVER